MSNSSIDPKKAKKRYIILTHLEKYNVNDHSDSGIKEEIEAQNDKTHYPLPLSMVEIAGIQSIKEQKISKQTMKQMIQQMSEQLRESQGGSVMNTQTSGFGMGGSMLNHTINSKSDMLMSSERSSRRTAREFFSKEN
jgi:hypothetical protein